jgi:carbonic anhydrase
MKRLFVREEVRGLGLGGRLASAAVQAGRRLGYRRMVLDTLGRMTSARRLYAGLGFEETAAYYDNPLPDVRYMARAL